MVTPTNGTVLAVGKSGRTYAVNAYISDVIGAPVTFAVTGGVAGTGSPTYWIPPEEVTVTGLSIKTGPTVATVLTLTSNAQIINASMYAIADNLNTLAFRQPISIRIAAGNQFGLLQG